MPTVKSTAVPTVRAAAVGWLTAAQMRHVDHVMIQELHIDLIQMMENAGRTLADLVVRRWDPATATVLAGTGGNGGGGLVAARHLANRGVLVQVVLSKDPSELTPVPAHQLDILGRMGVPVVTDVVVPADVVVDALIGYSLQGQPRGRVARLIANLGAFGRHVVSLDTPSGLDVTDGSVPGVVVRADATLTLALPKTGLRYRDEVGELYLADISVPASVYLAMNVGPAPDFGQGQLLRISP
ncbi:MAG: NAD(P)H-hydrate epimerase [Euzebya sp.]